MFSNDMPVEVKYQLNIELLCKEYTGHNGICPMTALNSFKLWLKQYEDLVECTKFELIPRLLESDPFSRQRKWIGKTVKGWTDNDNYLPPIYGILNEIRESCYPSFLVDGTWCYQVSPVDENELAKDE